MTAEALKSYVHTRLKKGYPAGELRHELLRQGYALDDMNWQLCIV